MWKCNYKCPKGDILFCIRWFFKSMVFLKLAWLWISFSVEQPLGPEFCRIYFGKCWYELLNARISDLELSLEVNQLVPLVLSTWLAQSHRANYSGVTFYLQFVWFLSLTDRRIFFKYRISWINTYLLHTYTWMKLGKMFNTHQLESGLTMGNITNFGVVFQVHDLLPVKLKCELLKLYKSQFLMCKWG